MRAGFIRGRQRYPYRIGQQAARLFLELMQEKESFQPRTFVITGDLVIRQSSLKDRVGSFKLGIYYLESGKAAQKAACLIPVLLNEGAVVGKLLDPMRLGVEIGPNAQRVALLA